MTRILDRERAARRARDRATVDVRDAIRNHDEPPRAVSAADAVRRLAPSPASFHLPVTRENRPSGSLNTDFPPHVARDVWRHAVALAKSVCVVCSHAISQAHTNLRAIAATLFAPPPQLRSTILAGVVVLTVAITATLAGSEIDLSKLVPGNDSTGNRPRIVIVDGKLVNQGDAPATNLEVTRPSYRLIGNLQADEAIDLPAADFTIQYEWNEGEKVHRESKSFKTSNDRVAGTRTALGGIPQRGAAQRGAPLEGPNPALIDSGGNIGNMPPGLSASYDPATHLLTVSAARPTEVRVDGFLLRPISRTDKDGADYRYAQANILVMGQDLKRGETTTFEVVFTKPQDFYSIPIYAHEPGKPAVYLTVSVSTGNHS